MRIVILIAVVVASVAAPVSAFDAFIEESSAVSDLIGCPTPKLTSDAGLPDMWGCILPGAEVLKVFINEAGGGEVANVKVMWNDWTKDTGYGLHTDQPMAEAWVATVATRYAPEAVDRVLEAFKGTADVSIAGEGHLLAYTYFKGPAIDERLITITSSPEPTALPANEAMADNGGRMSLICRNPRREYNLVYAQGEPAVVINPDSDNASWPVLSVLFDDRQHVVIADLGQPRMTAQVHLRPYMKVDIFSGGQLVQTDGCHS